MVIVGYLKEIDSDSFSRFCLTYIPFKIHIHKQICKKKKEKHVDYI